VLFEVREVFEEACDAREVENVEREKVHVDEDSFDHIRPVDAKIRQKRSRDLVVTNHQLGIAYKVVETENPGELSPDCPLSICTLCDLIEQELQNVNHSVQNLDELYRNPRLLVLKELQPDSPNSDIPNHNPNYDACSNRL